MIMRHALDRGAAATPTHFVADHFSPFVVGQLPCRECLSSIPSGVRLRWETTQQGKGGGGGMGVCEGGGVAGCWCIRPRWV
jgi:hypothetical protein